MKPLFKRIVASFAGFLAELGEHLVLRACLDAVPTTEDCIIDLSSIGGPAAKPHQRQFLAFFYGGVEDARRLLSEDATRWCGSDFTPERDKSVFCDHKDCMTARGIVLAKWRSLHPQGPACLCWPRSDGRACVHGTRWPEVLFKEYSAPIVVAERDLGFVTPPPLPPLDMTWKYIPLWIR